MTLWLVFLKTWCPLQKRRLQHTQNSQNIRKHFFIFYLNFITHWLKKLMWKKSALLCYLYFDFHINIFYKILDLKGWANIILAPLIPSPHFFYVLMDYFFLLVAFDPRFSENWSICECKRFSSSFWNFYVVSDCPVNSKHIIICLLYKYYYYMLFY